MNFDTKNGGKKSQSRCVFSNKKMYKKILDSVVFSASKLSERLRNDADECAIKFRRKKNPEPVGTAGAGAHNNGNNNNNKVT